MTTSPLDERIQSTRQMFARAAVGMAVCAPDGRFLAPNAAYCDMLGYTEAELLAVTATAVTHPDEQAGHRTMLAEMQSGARDNSVRDKRYVHKNGEIVFSRVSVSAWRDAHGALIALMAIAEDVSPRKRAEDFAAQVGRLGQSAMRGEPLAQQLADAVRLLQAQIPGAMGSVLLLDEHGLLQHGAAPDLPAAYNSAVVGLPIGPCAGSCGTAAFRKSRVVVCDIHQDPLWAEYKALAMQHGLRACWSTPMVDQQGRVLGTFALYHREPHTPSAHELELVDTVAQVTGLVIERATREAELQLNEQIFRSLFDQNPDAVYSLDLEGRILTANGGLERLTGYPMADMLNQPYLPFIAPEQRDATQAQFLRAAAGTPVSYETVGRRGDGQRVALFVTNMPIVVNRNIVGVYGIARDVTARKRDEAALARASRALEMASRCNAALMRADNEQALLEEICGVAVQVGGARLAWVGYALDDANKTIDRRAFNAVSGGYLTNDPMTWAADAPGGQLPVARAIRSGEMVVVPDLAHNDTTDERRKQAAKARGYRGLIALPLMEGDRTFGVLAMFYAEEADLPARELAVLREMASNLAYGISALRARAMVREQAKLLDKAHDAIVVRDLQGRVVFWNQGAERLYGWSSAEAIGATVFELAYDDEAGFHTAMRVLLEKGEWTGELEHRTKAGQRLTVEAGWTLVRNDQGAPTGVFTINTDVSARKRVEREMQRTNRALQMLSRGSDVLIRATSESELLQTVCQIAVDVGGYRLAWVGYAMNGPDRRVEVQRYAGDGAGYMEHVRVSWLESAPGGGGITGQTIRTGRTQVRHDIRNPRWRGWDAAIARGFRSVISLPLRSGTTTFGLLMLYRADVLVLPAGELQLLQELADNLAFGIVNLRYRDALRQSDAKYRTLFDSNPQPMGVYNPETLRFVAVNPAAVAFYGYSPAEFLAMGVEDTMSSRSMEPWLRKALARPFREPRTLEWQQRKKNGDLITVEATISSMVFEGQDARLALVNDVTERRRTEQQITRLTTQLEDRVRHRTAQLESVNKELEAFSYSVAHDIRQPLSSVSGFAYLLSKAVAQDGNASARHYLDRIQTGVKQMGDMTDALLSLSRLSRAELKWEAFDLSALAQELVALNHEAHPGRAVRAVVEPGLRAQGDPRLIRQVLQNLLLNAWKFTAHVAPAEVTVGQRALDDGELAFFVRDNGAGFDMAFADKLFGAFQRLHSPSEFEGTGIGLANVKRIVTRHGGRVWAASAPGEGATFYFTLGSAPL
ncbi:MAG: PAS domain S-box protein [Burkholderiales bacterium]|nr:PAS domain S-box protein [Burkholderiales bacterium]